MISNRLTIRQKLYSGFGISIVLMLIVLGYTYMNFTKVSKVVATNLSTYQVLRESDAILTCIFNIDAGGRGYIITGDEKFLEPYNTGRSDFQLHYDELKQLVSGNETQLIMLEDLTKAYRLWLGFQMDILAQKRMEILSSDNNTRVQLQNSFLEGPPDFIPGLPPDSPEKAKDLFHSDKGKELRDNLSAILDDINNEGKKLLEEKSENLITTQFNTYLSILIGGLIITISAILVSIFTSLSITNPIKMLIAATENITKHNYQTPIQLTTDKDLDVLIKNFNLMLIAIQTREDELCVKNEAIQVQMNEANEANRLKGQFLANVSHELRTPLNSIIGFTTRVIKKSGDILPATQLENLKIVKEEAYHLLDLISNLLDYSKMEAGKMNIQIETFNLNDAIVEVNDMTKTLVESKNLEYQCEILSIENNMIIKSDRLKIKQILINLISNAIKYSEKGTIKIQVDRILNDYCIKVKDQGIGIAAENLQNIFDEFRQVDGSYTRKAGGTGLGLSITKNLVELLGGRIEVTSSLGMGSCFTVYLPIDLSSGNVDFKNSQENQESTITTDSKTNLIGVM
ncbi:ATP-binding protein [Desulfosporosinus nitroreducens]|uniref:histidine kinase n=1 Tax=Desulfosporosinus nitroreducens TaxID=2018668 RepID=A0ABT8QKS2_9FIRM|nr:ATP-binding protein [Desulfosporosinus nitroreducens]MDO0821933.1 ATP-binding protein [Desulfosporosinus nitroreducens]